MAKAVSAFTIADVLPAIGGRIVHGNPESVFDNFCIDSRFVDDRTIFVPLMGQSRDGHQFILDSIGKGAAAVLVRSGHHLMHEILSWLQEHSRRPGGHLLRDVCVIEVRHTLISLQRLAEWYRNQFDVTVLGITGSVGKTGTKEMMIQLLSSKFNTVGTEKNFNNEIGVPLALSQISGMTEKAVVEMAMRARGEISLLSKIARPNLAVITNTSGSHVGRLGSFEEVVRAKSEIVDGLDEGGTVIVNRADQNIGSVLAEINQRTRRSKAPKVMLFDASAAYESSGISPFMPPVTLSGSVQDIPEADVWVEDVEMLGLDGSVFTLCSREEKVKVQLNQLGRGAIENLCCAAACCYTQEMSLKEIAEAAPHLMPAPQRLNLYQLRPEHYLIDDCYNSSPSSARDSLELMLSISDKYRKILVLGDMLELGKFETLLHRQFALTALNLPFDAVFAVGPRMNAVNEVECGEGVELFYMEGHSDLLGSDDDGPQYGKTFGGRNQRRERKTEILDDTAAERLSDKLNEVIDESDEPTVVMIKGSRAIHLERVVNDLLGRASF